MSNQMDEKVRPIIIRRIKKIKKGRHHGGSWKIAYADFVTAMMAFFLMMWLLGLLNKSQLAGIANYFKKPLKDAFVHQPPPTAPNKFINKEKGNDKHDKNPDNKTNAENTQQVPPATLTTMQMIKGQLDNKMQTDPKLQQYKNNLDIQVTADGLKIILHDLENQPMFSNGTPAFDGNAEEVIKILANELNKYPNRIVVYGHTSNVPYAGSQYENWELSADRAAETRRRLVREGLNDDKVIRITGLADTKLLDKNDGKDAINRRIEIMVLTDDALKKLPP